MRKTEILKYGFKFKKFELGQVPENVFTPDFDDSDWRTVRVPHDWGIEGDFCEDNDPSVSTVIEDGITKPRKHTGRSGALPTVGEGVYRKWIDVPDAECAVLEFDGIMWLSTVYVNGIKAGGCHFGYKSFEVDITDLIKKNSKNLIVVHAVVLPDMSRWYSGGGIYRNVRFITKPKQHIAYNGVWVRQAYADVNQAIIDIEIDSVGTSGFTARITAPSGEEFVSQTEDSLTQFYIEKPILWDVDSPSLYKAEITLESGDSVTVTFGIRVCEFTKKGFFLNGRNLKMNGVCMHHDLGSIGAAVNVSALRRQIEILKGMGVNAIRTSHNPPAPELLDLCDEMGILVMDEFFDEWRVGKVKNGYSQYFDKHALTDVADVVRRDRNHPSVIMWSTGNEIKEQSMKDGWKVARLLNDATHTADPTRPTTNGFSSYPNCFNYNIIAYVDIVGLNYKPHLYKQLQERYPNLMFVGTETESCVSTRGVYHLPAEIEIDVKPKGDLAVSAYELAAPRWAYYPERELAAQKDVPENMGEFIWTGFDYMGEPTPYYSEWPSRSSYFGVVDLAGLPKNRYYCYRSFWTDVPTLHVFPHWNWEGCEGDNVPVHVYTNYDEVELFINGVSQGRQSHKDAPDDIPEMGAEGGAHLGRFRLMWNDTVYQPGEITAVAYKDGKEAERKTVKTAGAPHRIILSAYNDTIAANGDELNYITATIVDKDGNVCPKADNRLTFSVSGEGEFIATDAGDQRETETFLRPDKKALSGMLVCCVRSTQKAGSIKVCCTGDGLEEGRTEFKTV